MEIPCIGLLLDNTGRFQKCLKLSQNSKRGIKKQLCSDCLIQHDLSYNNYKEAQKTKRKVDQFVGRIQHSVLYYTNKKCAGHEQAIFECAPLYSIEVEIKKKVHSNQFSAYEIIQIIRHIIHWEEIFPQTYNSDFIQATLGVLSELFSQHNSVGLGKALFFLYEKSGKSINNIKTHGIINITKILILKFYF